MAAKEQERGNVERRGKRTCETNEKIKHREEMRELKVKHEEPKRLDKERFEATKRIQEHNYRVAHMRVKRSEAWWRENADKKKEMNGNIASSWSGKSFVMRENVSCARTGG